MSGLPAWILLAGAGLLAGFFNVVAGGGSLLTIPALILMGFPPAVANGTNRMAILSQNISSVLAFRRRGYAGVRTAVLLALPACVGAVFGTLAAIAVSDDVFRKILSAVMLIVTALIFTRRPSESDDAREAPRAFALQVVLFTAIGFYGGFIQAGVGFLIMAALSGLGRLPLVRTNSMKVLVVAIYTIPSLVLFVANGRVAWLPAVVLAAGNAAGGWLGTVFTVSRGEKWIRLVLAAAVVAMACKLIGLF